MSKADPVVRFHVGDVVRKLRETRGLKVDGMGDLNKATISKIENGGDFRRTTLARIAALLGSSIEDIEAAVPKYPGVSPASTEESELLYKFRALSRPARMELLAVTDWVATKDMKPQRIARARSPSVGR